MAQRSRASTMRSFITPSRSENLAFSTPKAALRKSASRPGGVKAMAAMWEGASKDPSFIATPAPATRKQVDTVSGSVISPYSENVTPPKTVPPVRLTLQKQLEARDEEASSLRRQLETRENMDIGTLSEQLREAKRESAMWKSRAEAAEKRLAVFEGFTMRLRDIRVPQVDSEAAADDEAAREVHEEGHESDGSTKTTRTEEIGVLTNRIRQSLKGLDGARSSSAASSTTSDGGASAWWNQPKQDGVGLGPSSGARFAHGGGRMPKDVLEIAEEVWAAAQELLGHEGATWEEREGHQA
ncbi:hypothetical protein VD0003_g1333 [Verticillium dahliae]|nr:hypothetical protein VD0003_g1333 [Verticillium dahliae]